MTGESGRSAVFNVLHRSLKIGRGEDDTIRTGMWEAGWSGEEQSQKVKTLNARFERLVELYNAVGESLCDVPVPLQGDFPARHETLASAIDRLHKQTVGNNDTERDAFIESTEREIGVAEVLDREVRAAVERAAKRPEQVIAYELPESFVSAVPIDLRALRARLTTGNGALSLYRKKRRVESVTLNPGGGQPLEIRAQETAEFRAATVELKVQVVRAVREIEWTPPDEIEWGAEITVESCRASASGSGGALHLDVTGLATVGEARTLRIIAPGSDGWHEGVAEAKVKVQKAKRTIDWSPPATVVFGAKLDAAVLKAKASVGDGRIEVTAPERGEFTSAGSGQKLEVTLAATEFYAEVKAEATVVVTKARTAISWKEPASVVVGTKLGGSQLNAKVEPKFAAGALTYDPKSGTEMTTAGPAFLSAIVAETKNATAARKEVRLRVHDNAKKKEGYESMRDGTRWNKPASGDAKALVDSWESDDGSDEDSLKMQGQRLMSKLSTMTSEELIEHMNGLATDAADRHSQGGTYPNEIWKFPNGIQVRYKSNGSQHNPGVPMFCIEARTSAGFSAGQNDIAFKITADGEPAAKGPSPSDTDLPTGLSDLDLADFRSGTCDATHLRCRPKEDQTLQWGPLAPITEGAPLGARHFAVTQVRGDGALTFTNAAGAAVRAGTVLPVGDGQVLKVKAAATRRFNAAEATVTIDVKPKT